MHTEQHANALEVSGVWIALLEGGSPLFRQRPPPGLCQGFDREQLALLNKDAIWMAASMLGRQLECAFRQPAEHSARPAEQLELGLWIGRRCQRFLSRRCALGLRFSQDPLAPGERFKTLKDRLGDAFEVIEISSKKGNEHNFGKMAHSVLTLEVREVDLHPAYEARKRVVEFLTARLK